MTPRKLHFPDTTELMYIRNSETHNTHKIYTHSTRQSPRMGIGEIGTKPHSTQEAVCNCYLLRKRKSLFSNAVTLNHTAGQAPCSETAG